MNTVYLDEQFRTPGNDHLEEYRNSCFYPLLKKGVKERGSAYEEIAVKILRDQGHKAEVAPGSYGDFDIIVDGERYELKGSRKASPYDTRKREYQYSCIQDRGDKMMLMIIQPDDIVKLYNTTIDAVKKAARVSQRDADGKPVAYNLAKHPESFNCELIASVKVK